MTKHELIKNGLNDWALYFRRKLTDQVATMYLERIAMYSDDTIKHLFKTILEQEEKWPSLKFVTAFLQNQGEVSIEYDKEEDLRFPLGKLWEGLEVLRKHGETVFYKYCDNVNMPLNDRQRVIGKFKCAYDAKDLMGKTTTFSEEE